MEEIGHPLGNPFGAEPAGCHMTSARSSWASLLPLPAAVEEALPLPLALQWAHHAEQRSNACKKYIASVVNEEVLNALWTKIRDPIADIPTLPFVIRSSGCLRKVAAVSVEVGLLSMLNAILHDGDTAYSLSCSCCFALHHVPVVLL